MGLLDDSYEEFFEDTTLYTETKAIDKFVNERGKILTKHLGPLGFVVINGHAKSDHPA